MMLVNDVRSIRLVEIIMDFRCLQHFIAQTESQLSAEQLCLPGYSLLQTCITEAQAVLTSPYRSPMPPPPQDRREDENIKAQLQLYEFLYSKFKYGLC